MWLFTRDGYLSIVAHRDRPGMLLVRARRREDLAAAFPAADIQHTPPPADYPFRAVLPADQVAEAAASAVRAIDYDNFKATIRDPERHDVYLDVWATLVDWGRGRRGRRFA